MNWEDYVISSEKYFRPNEVSNLKGDSSVAKKILNWEPKISLDEGLNKTVEWYNKNKSWLKEVNFI